MFNNKRIRGVVKGCFSNTKLLIKIYVGMHLFLFLLSIILGEYAFDIIQLSMIYIMGISFVLSVSAIKTMMALGANRKDYYLGMMIVFILVSMFTAVFNLGLYYIGSGLIEVEMISNYMKMLNWENTGFLMRFFSQVAIYLFLALFVNFIMSIFVYNRVTVVLFIVLLFITTAAFFIYNELLKKYLIMLIINPEKGISNFVLPLFMSGLFLYGGWFFTKRREIEDSKLQF